MPYRQVTRRRLAVDRHQLLILLVAAVMIGSFLLLVLRPQQRQLSTLSMAVARERMLVKQKVQTSRKGIYVGARIVGSTLRKGPSEGDFAVANLHFLSAKDIMYQFVTAIEGGCGYC